MKKWYLWFIMALIWVICGIINHFNGAKITGSIVVASIHTFLGFAQLICDRKGETGQRTFRYISFSVLALCVLAILILLIIVFKKIPK